MNANELSGALLAEMGRAVVGQDELCQRLVVCLLAGGHVLIEGAPGLGKTLVARTMAKAVDVPFKRVQFTPDLMPSDILGTNVFDTQTGRFALRRGPIFTSFLLADEINRTPPKTQSALLEAMEEERVTIDGDVYDLAQPYMVFATQNPIEYEGTYPLPEAQLDRFIMKLTVSYPARQDELRLYQSIQNGFDSKALHEIRPMLSAAQVLEARAEVRNVRIQDSLLDYVISILKATREDESVLLGASPRAGGALLAAAKAVAVMDGRDYAVPEDFYFLAKPVLCHRLILTPDAEIEGLTSDIVLEKALQRIPIPR